MEICCLYCCLLRGINVSGRNLIKMASLQETFKQMGFTHVKTYLQSGNVFFKTSETDVLVLRTRIEDRIFSEFGHKIPVMLLSDVWLKEVFNHNPFIPDQTKDEKFLHVTFLAEPPLQANVEKLRLLNTQPDKFQITEKAVYLYCPNGYGNSKLTNNTLEAKLKVLTTTRNWKTITQLNHLIS